MTNNISQKICEACGIKPQHWCSYHDCICPIQDIGKFNSKCPKQAVTKECDARSHKPRYIDFENKNFTKLFNLKYDTYDEATIAGYIYLGYKNIINTRWFLGYLLFELEHNKSTDIEKIKQAIKEATWSM